MSEHITVLLREAVEHLNIRPDGVYVDATVGGGGHSEAILRRLTTGRLIGFDQDDYALMVAGQRLAGLGNFSPVKANFSRLRECLSEMGIIRIDGILYDLGVSSFQFDMPERGFSYQSDALLDMRMDPSGPITAYDLVNGADSAHLLEILYRYGEEANAKQIVKGILKARATAPIRTTFDLVNVIKCSLPDKILSKKGHPAKQTFQALRIAVNDELRVFENSLLQAIELLNPGGRVVVITFHSLEDRICKTIFREKSTVEIPKGLAIIPTEKPVLSLVNKHVILPSETEQKANNRAHSAKMRVAEKNPF